MDIIETINNAFENEKREGTLSKEMVKKVIEKIVDNFLNLKPTSQEEYTNYVLNSSLIVVAIVNKSKEFGIDMTPTETCQEIVKSFIK